MRKTGKMVNKNRTTETGNSGWALAIARAQEHLQKNRIQAARLRAALRVFRKMARAGKPWPGLKAQQYSASRIIGQDR